MNKTEKIFWSFFALIAIGGFLVTDRVADTSVNRQSFVVAASHDTGFLYLSCGILGDANDGGMLLRCLELEETPTEVPSGTPEATVTDTPEINLTSTEVPSETSTDTPEPTVSPTDTATPTATNTATLTPTITRTSVPSTPFVGAPECTDHNNSTMHTLWDSARVCHYDHEHGTSPFTAAVAAAFPDFDLKALLGNVEIGHTNPSSPMENTHKHGGFKWQVDLNAPKGCAIGFESGTVAVDAYAVQYHSFGRQDVEFEANKHSAVALLRQCKASNPTDKGYVYVATLQHYGERVTPYQGQTLQYPDDFLPRWDARFGPYFSTDNTNNRTIGNPNNLQQNSNSKWTSKLTGCPYPCAGARPPFSTLYRHLFDIRDGYQIFDMTDLVHPFKWLWMCGGNAYNPANCRYNNSTGTIHEVMGNIPAAWDNAAFDSDPRVGRITAEFFVDAQGVRNTACTEAGGSCYPIKMVSAFVGLYSSDLCATKCSNNTWENTRERDIYFLNGAVVNETTPGAIPSGWILENN